MLSQRQCNTVAQITLMTVSHFSIWLRVAVGRSLPKATRDPGSYSKAQNGGKKATGKKHFFWKRKDPAAAMLKMNSFTESGSTDG